ncbi:hypothetical protein IX39_12365 [Chryseobacterium formosense]|uniref:Uncharacterized protein n=1 Tax=Chryseobacterium formosense TaxID=236814 RepID=A0A085ZA98_9FLAO|nr:hypothetical protein IX39_12365 [Chryseobacterium formosense]
MLCLGFKINWLRKSGSKNAIPPWGRKRIFAENGATPFQKHCRAWLLYVFEKRLLEFKIEDCTN